MNSTSQCGLIIFAVRDNPLSFQLLSPQMPNWREANDYESHSTRFKHVKHILQFFFLSFHLVHFICDIKWHAIHPCTYRTTSRYFCHLLFTINSKKLSTSLTVEQKKQFSSHQFFKSSHLKR